MHQFVRFPLVAAVYLSGCALSTAQITIMPMGDSITVGVDYSTNSSGGYRAPLDADLTSAGLNFKFEGSTNTDPDNAGVLAATGDTYHNGYGHYFISDLTNNLNNSVQPSGGDNNGGGYWLTGGGPANKPAQQPNLLLLEIGTNDFLQIQGNQPAEAEDAIKTLLQQINKFSSKTSVLVAGAIPVNNDAGFNAQISAYNSYIQNTLVPTMPYARYVDLYDDFIVPGSKTTATPTGVTISSLYGADNIHPNAAGYPVIAATWATAIEQYEAVPEPSTWGLLGVGFCAYLFAGRRRGCRRVM